ncbi:MAG: superoxide dismutase family protein [Clostridia bacterium]|nr:superoxide dismutase family protein [Clostridia bacterium]
MNRSASLPAFETTLRSRPWAWAQIRGDVRHPQLHGLARFYPTALGTLVALQVSGLPTAEREVQNCRSPIFALHIHEGESCTGNSSDPFANVGTHDNPYGCPHPYHAGDMPPLFGADGYAISVFLTARFTVDDVLGKTIVIHSAPDDFTTQPAGNAGAKIACGEIKGYRRARR